jgi:hypothetical protein
VSNRAVPPRPGLLLGLLAGLLNVNFLLEWSLRGHTPIATTMVSDLATSGRPWFWAFRLGDAISAALLIVLCLLAWRAGSTASWRWATALLLLFALFTLFAVVFPEQCAGSTDASCPTQLTEQAWADALHDLISSVGTSCGVLACLAFAWTTRGKGLEPIVHLVAGVLAGVLGLVFVVVQQLGVDGWLGWTQRAQIVVLSAWYAAVGWSVDGRRAAARTRPGTMPL